MPRSIRESWRPENDPRFATKTAKDYEIGRRMLRREVELVEAMNRAGVRLIAGTDVGNPFAFPGFSLHDELALLVEAGLSPRQALRSATSAPAEFLGRTGDLGTIERGKIADLVLLDRNPLEDIHNTTAISAVVAGGRLYDRAALDGMLAEAQRIANLQSIAQRFSETIEAKGIGPAVALYRDLKAHEKDSYDFSEQELNVLGYKLMATKKSTEAIQIFELNVEAYPDSANAYDSLADAYAEHGDRQLAIESYRKTLQLDGANTATAVKLKKLEGMDAVR
jgi:tetratricopeptide (TPR) repeat protein